MREFPNHYYGSKRAALTFSAITILLCYPNIRVNDLSLIGMNFSGLELSFLAHILFIAAIYYFSIFCLTAFTEARTILISQNKNVDDIKNILSKNISEIKVNLDEIKSGIQNMIGELEATKLHKLVKEFRQKIDKDEVKIHFVTSKMHLTDSKKVSPEFFNLISSIFSDAERRIPASRQLDLEKIRASVTDAFFRDYESIIEQQIYPAVVEWLKFTEGNSKVHATEIEAIKVSLVKYQSSISEKLDSTIADLDSKLFHLNLIESVRSIRFWFFECGAAILMIILAMFVLYFPSHGKFLYEIFE